jgi:hypothetical protein
VAGAVLSVAGGSAGAQSCPEGLGEPTASYWLEGTIGGSDVRMYLERGGAVVAGVYYYTRHGAALLLRGEWANGEVRLEETTDNKQTGSLRGHLGPGGMDGVWSVPVPAEGAAVGGARAARSVAVRLHRTKQPSCDGRGPWRRFDDPAWPMTFSYPADWSVQRRGASLEVTCPDPATLLYDDPGVSMTTGVGLNRFARGEGGAIIRCNGKWHFLAADQGGCDCSALDSWCPKADVKQRDGLTVVSGLRAWRMYCRGGSYQGQSDSQDYLFIDRDHWVTISGWGRGTAVVDRIAASFAARPSSAGKPDAGR